jgi:hypothetical protein
VRYLDDYRDTFSFLLTFLPSYKHQKMWMWQGMEVDSKPGTRSSLSKCDGGVLLYWSYSTIRKMLYRFYSTSKVMPRHGHPPLFLVPKNPQNQHTSRPQSLPQGPSNISPNPAGRAKQEMPRTVFLVLTSLRTWVCAL